MDSEEIWTDQLNQKKIEKWADRLPQLAEGM